jgi:hypothetical protein
MKKWIVTLLVLSTAIVASADTTLVFGFDTTDSGLDVNGIEDNGGVKQGITFSGAVTGTDTIWNDLDGGISSQVNFSIGAVGDLAGLSGTLTPIGGDFNIGGNGSGIVGGNSNSYIDSGEAWVFTFSSDVTVTSVRYYGGDDGGQSILTNGTAVAGSPFDDDPSGLSIFVSAGDALTFGQAGTLNYGLQDFTVTVVPEPATIAMFGIGGIVAWIIRRSFRA